MTPPLYKMGVVLPLERSEGMDVFMLLLFVTSMGSTLSFLAGEAGVAHAVALTVAAAPCFSSLAAGLFASLFAAACFFLPATFFFHSLQGGF